jgi:hypothetical protein
MLPPVAPVPLFMSPVVPELVPVPIEPPEGAPPAPAPFCANANPEQSSESPKAAANAMRDFISFFLLHFKVQAAVGHVGQRIPPTRNETEMWKMSCHGFKTFLSDVR